MNERIVLQDRTVIDTLWLILSAGLVFLMQPGFMCLESGLTRSKNNINVAAKNFADFGVALAIYWILGYGLMFGQSLWGWIGSTNFFVDLHQNFNLAAFFVFQAMFCGTATTIVSGAIAERVKFISYMVISCLSSGLIYPVVGHWIWGGINQGDPTGWLGRLGFTDFAGSTVVHSVGGWISLAVLVIIGSRTGRFSKTGQPQKMQGSNLPLSTMGALLLWLGWIGFNGGSNLAFNEAVPTIITNTLMAGTAGMISASVLNLARNHLIELETLLNGSLAGLVAITAGCHAVSTPVAVVIGVISGWVMWQTTHLLERWQIDDAVGAIPVHLGGGIWGTLSAGLFAMPHDSLEQFLINNLIQILGITVTACWSFGMAYICLRGINKHFPLRVSLEEEEKGLNVVEHQAKTESYDLMSVMVAQAQSQDLSLRVPVDPFTEFGHIARRYNQVMDSLEVAVAQTEAIIRSATDAILTFHPVDFQILSVNPEAEKLFGYTTLELCRLSLRQLLEPITGSLEDMIHHSGIHEFLGRRSDSVLVPLEASIAEAISGGQTFYTGIFRDISERKAAEEQLTQAHDQILLLNKKLQAENLKLSAELDITRQIQQMILPAEQELRALHGLEISGFMQSVETVGGDYYDVLQKGDQIKIGIGDITGHGLHSCLLMLMVQTAVRTLLTSGESDPKRFLSILNRVIYDNVQRMKMDRILSLSFIDYQEGRLHLSGQHEELILIRQGGKIERVDTIDLGFPIGLEEDITAFIGQTEIHLNSGDLVVLYTDGITEAENAAGEFYGLDRLCELVSRSWEQSPWEIQSLVIEDVREYIGSHKVYDDITLLVLKQK